MVRGVEPPLTRAAGCESAGCNLTECGACGYPDSGMSGGSRHSDAVRADSVGCEYRPRGWGRVGYRVVGGGYASFGRRASAGQELQLQLQFRKVACLIHTWYVLAEKVPKRSDVPTRRVLVL